MFDTLIKFSKDREKMDFYATDKRATHELLKREQFISPVYEPACGEGHIGKILEELVLCQEIVQDKKRKFYYPARTSFSLDWLARYNFSNSLGDKYPQ